MALFDGLLGGSSADPYDLYGDILSERQRAALRARSSDQTWANAANFLSKAAMPTNKKIPLGGLLAGLAGAMGGSNQDEAVQTALKGALTTQQIAKLKREQKLLAELDPIQKELLRRQLALGGGGAPAAPTVNLPGIQTVPPAALDADLLPYAKGPPAQPGGGDFPGITGSGAPAGSAALNPANLQGLLALAGSGGGGDDIWSRLASMQGGVAPGTPPFDMASLGADQGLPDPATGGPDVVIPSGPRLQRSDLTNVAAPAGAFDYGVDYLQKTFGLAPHQARGAVKWMQNVESGLNPSIVNPKSGAFGVAQHLGPRKDKLLGQYGPQPSLEQQFSFIGDELRGPEAASLRSLRGAQTEDEAFRVWGRDFERPSAAEYARATGDPGRMINIKPLSGEAAPAGGSGVIPGLGITPEALATLNSMYKAAGVDSPFGSLLETYYKSPGYLSEKVRTEEQARKDIELKMDPLILEQRKRTEYKVDMELKPKLEEAVQRLQSPILKEREQAKADIDRVTKELEQAGAAALRPNDATIIGPGGVLTTQKITDLEFAKRQKARAERVAKGDTSLQPGDIVGTPTGAAPAEHEYIMTPQGALSARPVPGTPAAQKAIEAARKQEEAQYQMLQSRDIVVGNVDRIEQIMENAVLPTTGAAGSFLANLGGTAAKNIQARVETLKARLSIDEINRIRNSNPTGAAFGNLTEREGERVAAAQVALDQAQSEAEFKDALRTAKQIYIDATTRARLPGEPVLKVPPATGAPPPATGAPRERRWNPKTNRLE